jgi:methionyl-tRNA formyltransferase
MKLIRVDPSRIRVIRVPSVDTLYTAAMSDSTQNPRIIFFGTPEFAAYILEELVKAEKQVVAVVTTPPKEQGRGLKTRPSAMHETADKLGIPVLVPTKLRDEAFVEQLRSYDADIFCVVAYKILPKEVYALPCLGAFNVHTSLLPKYRGAAPMHRAIMEGATRTGITTFLLGDRVDTGNILLQEAIDIKDEETVGELHDELMKLGAKLAQQTIDGLAAGTLHPKPQSDADATPAPKIFPEDCEIRFDRSAAHVHNQIRGLSPHPAAFTTLPNGERIKVYRSHVAAMEHELPPGVWHVSNDEKRLFVGTLTAPLEILEVQREGRKRMTTEEFLRGAAKLFTPQVS